MSEEKPDESHADARVQRNSTILLIHIYEIEKSTRKKRDYLCLPITRLVGCRGSCKTGGKGDQRPGFSSPRDACLAILLANCSSNCSKEYSWRGEKVLRNVRIPEYFLHVMSTLKDFAAVRMKIALDTKRASITRFSFFTLPHRRCD